MKRIFTIVSLLVCCIAFVAAQDDDSKYATELLKPSTEAPDFTFVENGNPTRLKDLRGSYVVIDFWATWCPDCRKDIPDMKSLYDKYSPRGVRFVGVSFDKQRDALDKYIEENKVAWPQYFEGKPWKETVISQQYHIKWIPSVYVIDKDGKVILSTVMIDKVEKKLTELCNIQ